MVGVPGKYKGCETCRLRRVKCDNTRPFCRKCLDGGRDCAGYERETVFIIGTIEDQGRCSSHPPRVVKNSRRGAKSAAGSTRPPSSAGGGGASASSAAFAPSRSSEDGEDEGRLGFGIMPSQPLRPAWDDLVSVSWRGREFRLQVAGLFTDLKGAITHGQEGEGAGGEGVFVSLPVYAPPDVRPGGGRDQFWMGARCLVHLAAPDGGQGGTDSICLFLYEHNNSSSFRNQPHWKDPSIQANTIRRLGPEAFRSFPAHHFFARIYRPNAIMTALLNRTPTFLSEPHWLTTPFEFHPKSPLLDHLLDLLSSLPSLLSRADRVLAQQHTLARRLMAQDLLSNCLDFELDLGRWFASTSQQPLFWLTPNPPSATAATFPAPMLSFRNTRAALAMGYYWTALVTLYPTIWKLYFAAVLDPVVDDGPAAGSGFLHHPQATHQDMGIGMGMGMFGVESNSNMDVSVPGLPVPPRLQALDPMRYSLARVRDVAGDVCRAMEFLLAEGWVQPDLMWHMLLVVGTVFEEVGGMGMDMGGLMAAGDGRLEMMWCEAFRERLTARGREMHEVAMARRWVDLASF